MTMSDVSIRPACRAATVAARRQAVDRVVAAMRERLHEALSLHEMAALAHLSPFHFARVFRDVTGIPPGEFLNALRLAEAKRLLLTTDLSVTEVCFHLGYRSLGTFTTRFTQLVGVPPGRLRRLVGAARGAVESLPPAGPAVEDACAEPSLNGWVSGADVAPGPIFVGLFAQPIPQGRPIACTRLRTPGPFHITHIPDGRYHLLAAALPWSDDPLAYLLPGERLRVAAGARPVVVRAGRVRAPGALHLRPPRQTDPPLLSALPLLRSAPALASAAV